MMMTKRQQDAAAHRQFEALGWEPWQIAESDAEVEAHVRTQLELVDEGTERERHVYLSGMLGCRQCKGAVPRADHIQHIGWCDDHQRYFYWDVGCRAERIPTSDEVRTYYASLKGA